MIVDPPTPRRIGRVNWLGVWTLYTKEVRRFLNVLTQAVFAPVITALLFLAIFTLALGRAVEMAAGVPYAQFLAPGIVMTVIVQNAFANTSSSLLVSKIQGNIVDMLMPPLSAHELTVGYALAGMTRGLLVAVAAILAMSAFVHFEVRDAGAILFFGASASLLLSLLGLMTGIWADKFEHIAAMTNFVVMPLAFLSGSFYSIERLPGVWKTLARFNPFFYMIDGFRYGFIGHADGSLTIGVAVMLVLNLALWMICQRMLASGYSLTP
jgi:ABC-2 type transport system permease protein